MKSNEMKPWIKCTCSHRKQQRMASSSSSSSSSTCQPSSSATSSSSSSVNASPTSVNTPNKHSSLMQTVTLSAYHPSQPQHASIKSYSLLNDTDNRLDMHNETYEFVDSIKKASYLTGSARCTLVATSVAPHTSQTTGTLTSSRIRFGKSNNR
jgi:PBP1b-binding outer membrane lipoprotein LpoB